MLSLTPALTDGKQALETLDNRLAGRQGEAMKANSHDVARRSRQWLS